MKQTDQVSEWEEESAWEVDEGDVVTFSQFVDDHHEGMLRAVNVPPVMVMVNGKVIKAEEREIDTGGGRNVRMFLTIEIWAECFMHTSGMSEKYSFAEHGAQGAPVFEFRFTGDERLAVAMST